MATYNKIKEEEEKKEDEDTALGTPLLWAMRTSSVMGHLTFLRGRTRRERGVYSYVEGAGDRMKGRL